MRRLRCNLENSVVAGRPKASVNRSALHGSGSLVLLVIEGGEVVPQHCRLIHLSCRGTDQ